MIVWFGDVGLVDGLMCVGVSVLTRAEGVIVCVSNPSSCQVFIIWSLSSG